MAGNQNSGRKPQEENIEMIERLTPLDDRAFEELKKGVEKGEFKYIQLFFYYRYGKPRQAQEISVKTEQPLFDLNIMPDILFKKTPI